MFTLQKPNCHKRILRLVKCTKTNSVVNLTGFESKFRTRLMNTSAHALSTTRGTNIEKVWVEETIYLSDGNPCC